MPILRRLRLFAPERHDLALMKTVRGDPAVPGNKKSRKVQPYHVLETGKALRSRALRRIHTLLSAQEARALAGSAIGSVTAREAAGEDRPTGPGGCLIHRQAQVRHGQRSPPVT